MYAPFSLKTLKKGGKTPKKMRYFLTLNFITVLSKKQEFFPQRNDKNEEKFQPFFVQKNTPLPGIRKGGKKRKNYTIAAVMIAIL